MALSQPGEERASTSSPVRQPPKTGGRDPPRALGDVRSSNSLHPGSGQLTGVVTSGSGEEGRIFDFFTPNRSAWHTVGCPGGRREASRNGGTAGRGRGQFHATKWGQAAIAPGKGTSRRGGRPRRPRVDGPQVDEIPRLPSSGVRDAPPLLLPNVGAKAHVVLEIRKRAASSRHAPTEQRRERDKRWMGHSPAAPMLGIRRLIRPDRREETRPAPGVRGGAPPPRAPGHVPAAVDPVGKVMI